MVANAAWKDCLERKTGPSQYASSRVSGRVAVAYSGGIDSTLVLKVAHDALGDNAIGLTAVSASMPHYEQDGAAQIAQEIGARVMWINTHEDEDERYLDNPTNRCYFCKTNVYDELLEVAVARGLPRAA